MSGQFHWICPECLFSIPNVVSELRKVDAGKADGRVVAWSNSVEAGQLYISAITVLELESEVGRMERQDKRQELLLRQWFEGNVLKAFDGRILSIDSGVAKRCGASRIHVQPVTR